MKINFKYFLSGKFVLQVYFVFFIFLNIIDFLNIIGGDLDFFKKILSWILIGYIFYKVSLSKIFIGKRVESYDLAFILSFCLFSIPRALILYVSNIAVNGGIPNSYVAFHSLLTLIYSIDEQVFVIFTFILGILFTLILSIAMLLNYNYEKKSFLGSFNFKKGYFKYAYEQSLLSFFLIFFGLIIFNFFMEWFALAVDSLILIIGLIYYIFIYIHNHAKGKASSILQNISNAGNTFYQSLIGMFSDKKTIFIGISFLLTLHLLVDIGVYLIPYSIGTQNTLYFEGLNYQNLETGVERLHTPLFSFAHYKQSLLSKDLANSNGVDSFLTIGIILVYLVSVTALFFVMFLPFYIFYKNTQDKRVYFNSVFAILILSSLVFVISFKLFTAFDIFNANVNLPIDFDKPMSNKVKGVDIYTNMVFNVNIASVDINTASTSLEVNPENVNVSAFIQFLVSILIFCFAVIFLLFRYDKYKFFFDKVIFFVVLVFFLYYMFIFYTSTIEVEMDSLKNRIGIGTDYSSNILNYHNAISIYEDDKNFIFPGVLMFENNASTFKAKVFAFSDLEKVSQRSVTFKEKHNDYLLFDVVDYNQSTRIQFANFNNVYLKDEVYDLYSKKFNGENVQFIYFLGENFYNLSKVNDNEYSVGLNLQEDTIDKLFIFPNLYNTLSLELTKYVEYVRLFFSSIFYIIGSAVFGYYFFRKNIWV